MAKTVLVKSQKNPWSEPQILIHQKGIDHVAVKVGMKQVYNGIVLTKGEVLTFADQSCGDRNLTTVFSGV